MKIYINDVETILPDGASLADALATKQLPASGIATAINGKVVPAPLREGKKLEEGDKIVIIKAFYGG